MRKATYEDFKAIVKEVKYKPGWTFGYILPFHSIVPILVIEYTTLDSKDSGEERQIVISHGYPVPHFFDDDGHPTVKVIQAWIRDCIIRTETHELDEFLKFNDIQFKDPHA